MKALLLLLLASPALASGSMRRFAVFVGNDSGGQGTRELMFARDDARKLHDLFVRLGGVASDDAVLLLNDSSDALIRALTQVEQKLRQSQSSGQPTALFFYYSGHAKDGALRLGSSTLSMDSLKSRLAQAPADFRLAVFDACRSGALTRIKGMRRAPAFEVESDAHRAARGLVILTSSTSDEDSQESDSIGGSYFSHHLASGLWGEADKSGDGRVTLSEAYAYAYERTVADTADSAAGPQHPTFSFDLAGNGDLVLTDVAVRREGVKIPASAPAGAWFLVDPRGFVVAELKKLDSVERLVALPPGKYWVKRRLEEHLMIGRITVSAGEISTVDVESMKSMPFSDDPIKGAYQTMTYARHVGIALNGGYNWVFDKPLEAGGYFPSAPMAGLDVVIHNTFGRGWSLGIDGALGFSRGEVQLATRDLIPYNFATLVVGVSGLKEWPEGTWVPFVGVRLALNLMTRNFPGADLPVQTYQVFVPSLVFGLKIRFSTRWSLVARGRVHYLLYTVDQTRSLGSLELSGLINYEFGL